MAAETNPRAGWERRADMAVGAGTTAAGLPRTTLILLLLALHLSLSLAAQFEGFDSDELPSTTAADLASPDEDVLQLRVSEEHDGPTVWGRRVVAGVRRLAAGQRTAMGHGKRSERPQQPACSVLFLLPGPARSKIKLQVLLRWVERDGRVDGRPAPSLLRPLQR